MESLAKYLPDILLTLFSIVIGAGISYIFYLLQKKEAVSVQTERIKRAREELLDIIENHIINKHEISRKFINNLIEASEREHEVSLKDICSPLSLLQDVALRLQKSKHLDIIQKNTYNNQIEQVISTLKEVPNDAKQAVYLFASETVVDKSYDIIKVSLISSVVITLVVLIGVRYFHLNYFTATGMVLSFYAGMWLRVKWTKRKAKNQKAEYVPYSLNNFNRLP